MGRFWKMAGGALAMGLAWFCLAAFVALVVFEGFIDPDGKIADIWPAVLGYPAFICGVSLFILMRTFGGTRQLHEVPNRRAAVLGAISGGVVLPGVFFLLLAAGGEFPRLLSNWRFWLGCAGAAALSAAGGWATAAYLKLAQDRPIPNGNA